MRPVAVSQSRGAAGPSEPPLRKNACWELWMDTRWETEGWTEDLFLTPVQ